MGQEQSSSPRTPPPLPISPSPETTTFLNAVKTGDLETIRQCPRATLTHKLMVGFQLAIEEQQIEALALICLRVTVDARTYLSTIFIQSCKTNQIETVRLLFNLPSCEIAQTASPEARYYLSLSERAYLDGLSVAMEMQHFECARLVFDNRPSVVSKLAVEAILLNVVIQAKLSVVTFVLSLPGSIVLFSKNPQTLYEAALNESFHPDSADFCAITRLILDSCPTLNANESLELIMRRTTRDGIAWKVARRLLREPRIDIDWLCQRWFPRQDEYPRVVRQVRAEKARRWQHMAYILAKLEEEGQMATFLMEHLVAFLRHPDNPGICVQHELRLRRCLTRLKLLKM
eukprot:TRINITY_DN9994_c0_g1_i10.p1 TRINITY_DN9994_c0_g1~~TRINITY_DN9994_c0_g1_i10.p1  ORF type:complete len:345 (-),score=-13.30 TRINITY_DN9994_c0_g1_i10:113-1147(-)